MGKNNKGGNAFYYFMLEFKDKQGRSFKSMSQVATEAGPHWQRLSREQRSKYEEMARRNKETQAKQTTIGESIDLVLQEEKEKKEREQAIKNDIDSILRKCANTNTIIDQYFYVMHINEFCYWERGSKYFPAEIALGKFNLRNGIIKDDVYHALVHPGPLPLGYLAKVKLKADETHQIPYCESKNNMEEVLMALINKLTENSETDTFPPIYVSEKDVLLIENVLNWMCEDYGQPPIFKVYSLEYLFYSLRNSISSKGKVWPTPSISKIQLEKDIYDFCTGISCEYHETSQIQLHCSKSRIIRWTYIICDNCLEDLNLPMIIRGQHVPWNAQIDGEVAGACGVSIGRTASYAPSITNSERSDYQQCGTLSEVNTTVDENDASSYHGFDSESQTGDDEIEWRRPRRNRGNSKINQNLSQQTDTTIPLSQMSQTSSVAEYVPGRRPLSQSAGVAGASNSIRRGRGRGIWQNRPPM